MHQDVLWQAGPNESEGYWGVPPWIKHKVGPPQHDFPWPMVNPSVWECGYFTQEISQGFGQFFDNVNGVADDFANFWKIIAKIKSAKSKVRNETVQLMIVIIGLFFIEFNNSFK